MLLDGFVVVVVVLVLVVVVVVDGFTKSSTNNCSRGSRNHHDGV